MKPRGIARLPLSVKFVIKKSPRKAETALTLCLSAAAENGKFAVMVSDGMLSYGKVSGEVDAPKYQWYGDWLFMFAGVMSNTELVVEEIRQILAKQSDPDPFSRENIQKTVRRAFNQRVGNWAALRNLSMYGMDMDEFKNRGPSSLTQKVRSLLETAMWNDVKQNFDGELMVVGWGKMPPSIMLYVVNKYGDSSHAKDGHCAIGIGSDKALPALLKLKHGVRSSLQTTIYSALAAKFSAEGKWVGTQTDVWLLRKRIAEDDAGKPVAIPVPNEDIDAIRAIWKRQRNRGNIPIEAIKYASRIAALTNDKSVINRGNMELFQMSVTQSTSRKSKRAK